MNNENYISIFTPTYNRLDTLKTAYNSLLEQTQKNFIWVIIDDGSIDGTEKYVKKWIKDNKINIEYYRKDNGGKHTAYNFLLEKLHTNYVLIALDSDDYLKNDAIEFLNNKLLKIRDDIAGIVCLCDTKQESRENIHKYNVDILNNNSLQYNLKKRLFNAGAVFLFKVDYIKKFKYPEIQNEKFFTEAYIYYQMNSPLLWTNKVICIRDFRNDGLTKNIKKLYVNNPVSWYMYNKLRCELVRNWLFKIKYTIYMISFGKFAGINKIIGRSKNHLLTIALYPIGILGYFYLKKLGGAK